MSATAEHAFSTETILTPREQKLIFFKGWCRCAMVYGSPKGHSIETDVQHICDIKILCRAKLGKGAKSSLGGGAIMKKKV